MQGYSPNSLDDLKTGEHLCVLYDSPQQQWAQVAPFVRQGLARREKILYVTAEAELPGVEEWLRRERIPVEELLRAGQFAFLLPQAPDGEGEPPGAVIGQVQEAIRQALAAGYPALRLIMDVHSVVGGKPASGRLTALEAGLHMSLGEGCVALCQYDRRRFSAATLLASVSAHPAVLAGGRVWKQDPAAPAEQPGAFDPAEAALDLWLKSFEGQDRGAEQTEAGLREALAVSEARYRAMVEGSTALISRFRSDGTLTFVNEAYCRYFGKSREELLGKSFLPLVAEVDRPEIARLLVSGSPGPLLADEHRSIRADGEVRWTLWTNSAVVDAEGRFIEYQGVGHDITDRKLMEEALRRSEQRFRTAFEQAASGMILAALDGTLQMVNSSLCEMLGYTPEELTGRTFLEITWPEDREDSLAVMRRLLSGGAPRILIEKRYARKDGRPVWAQVVSALLRDPDSTPRHFIAQILDMTERKQAEDALMREKSLLDTLMDSLPDRISFKDPSGRFTRVNRAQARYLGIEDPAQALGKTDFDFLNPDLAAAAAAEERQILTSGKPEIGKIRKTVEPGGGRGWVSVTTVPTRDAAMNVTGTVAVTRDVTGWVRMQEALDRSREWLKRAQSIGNVGYWRADPVSGRAEWSEGMYRILGLPPGGPVLDRNQWLERIVPEDREAARNRIEGLVQGRSVPPFEFRIRRSDGEVRHLLSSVEIVLDGQGKPVDLIGTAADISGQKKIQEQLREANQTLEAIIQASPVAIIALDVEGRINSWNRAAERIFGWRAAEVLGQMAPFVPVSREAEARALRQKIVNGETVSGIEARRQRKDGSPVDVSLSAAPLRDHSGGVAGIMVVMEDITARRTLEEELRQAQRLESVGRLAGGVAHDFNNLLTVINGYCDLLLEGLEPDGSVRSGVEEIRKAGARAAGLTQQLLAFSRRQVLRPVLMNLNAIVAETEGLLRRLIGEDFELRTVLEPALGSARADTGQMQQVIVNLVVNARDAMPGGGTITIETANVSVENGSASEIPPVAPGRYVVLSVRDTGVGMDEETQNRIFEPFFTTKPVGRGTGLGLPTVYGIVRQSGGVIRVHSAPGKGATFRVYLPRVEESAAPETAADTLVGATGTETVMVVEDQEEVRALACEALRRHGYHVIQAAGGREALAFCGCLASPVHLLLTDLVMPGMSGRDLAERARALRPALKILFMSGYTDDALFHRGIRETGVAYIQKPFTPAALAAKIREVLGRPSPPG